MAKRIRRKETAPVDQEYGNQIVARALKEGCLLRVRTTGWGNNVVLRVDELGTLPKDIVKATKPLIAKTALDEVESIRAQASNWPYKNCLPWIDDGIHFIPKSRIEEGVAYLDQKAIDQVAAVERLIEGYEDEKAKMKARILEAKEKGSTVIFEEDRYPVAEELRRKWSITYSLFHLQVPDGTGVLSKEQYEQEKSKLISSMVEASEVGILTLRKAFTEMVVTLRDRLEKGERFNKQIVTNLQDFMDGFKTMNVWDDESLGELIERCKYYLDGVDPVDLRDDDEFASAIARQMDEVVTGIKSLEDEKLNRTLML